MRKFLAILGMMVAALVPVSIASPAEAVPGCNSNVQDRITGWKEVGTYPIPTPYGTFVERKISMNMNMVYKWCPNGSDPEKFKPFLFDYCYTFEDGGPTEWFEGVRFNPYVYTLDDFEYLDPPAKLVPSDGTRQNCKNHTIAVDNRKWFRADKSPRWKNTSHIVFNSSNNEKEVVFKDSSNSTSKIIFPYDDNAVSDWYS